MAYNPAMDGTTVRTLGEWGQFFKANGQPNDIIELMDQELSILDDIPWLQASDRDGHESTLRAKLPSSQWGRLYKGVQFSKSEISAVKDPVGTLEMASLVDRKFRRIYGEAGYRAYRMSEARAHTEGMRQDLSTALFYGSIKKEPDAINGFDPRYPFSDSPNVLDAGGTGKNLTSIWLVAWGENEVHGIFPKESRAGLIHEAKNDEAVIDDQGKEFRADKDFFYWDVGLSVRDWRCVVRICNIDVEKALTLSKGDAGFLDLHRLTISAKNRIPASKRPKAKWYMNSDMKEALELQASDSGNVQLIYRNQDARKPSPIFDSYEVPYIHSLQVRENDSILSNEKALKKAPIKV